MKTTFISCKASLRTLSLQGISFSSEPQGSLRSQLYLPSTDLSPMALNTVHMLMTIKCSSPACTLPEVMTALSAWTSNNCLNLSWIKQTRSPASSSTFLPLHTYAQMKPFPFSFSNLYERSHHLSRHSTLGVILDFSVFLYPHIQSIGETFGSTLTQFPNPNHFSSHLFLRPLSKSHHLSPRFLQYSRWSLP